jgi:endonuclease/exonuclease/phosphatase (EEP) superfamily protein YafD
MAGEATPARERWIKIGWAIALVLLAWTWLLYPHLGNFGQTLAIVGPLVLVGVVALHVAAFVIRRRYWIVTAVSLAAWLVSGSVMILSPRAPIHFGTPHDPVTIAAANLHFSNSHPLDAARDVVARHADVVVVSEGTLQSEPVISAAYRYHVNSAYHDAGYSEYVASRFPLRLRAAPADLGQAVVVEVMAPAPFVLVGVHLPRAGIDLPYLHGNYSIGAQREAVRAITKVVDASALPVVVAGDMNISDRTANYHLLVAHRRDAMRTGWAGTTFRTFPLNLLELRIDHVIIDRSWCARHATRFHPTGSDHESLQVEIGPCS